MVNYKGFTINDEGFKLYDSADKCLPRIALFIVRKGDLRAYFSFADGGIDMKMSDPDLKDERLLQNAVKVVEKRIDNNEIKHLGEYTFDYRGTEFVKVENPGWSQRLKKIMSNNYLNN